MGNNNIMNQVLPPVLCPPTLQQNNEPTPNIHTAVVDGNKQKHFQRYMLNFLTMYSMSRPEHNSALY